MGTFAILCWPLLPARIWRVGVPGVLFGIGLIRVFLTRFFLELIKTEQESLRNRLGLDMGQWLSIPFYRVGYL